MSKIDVNENFIKERLAHEKSEAMMFEQLQQLKQEKEELTQRLQFKWDSCEILKDRITKAEQKLEKIKEECEMNIYFFNGESYITKDNILQIIESEDVPNNNQQ